MVCLEIELLLPVAVDSCDQHYPPEATSAANLDVHHFERVKQNLQIGKC